MSSRRCLSFATIRCLRASIRSFAVGPLLLAPRPTCASTPFPSYKTFPPVPHAPRPAPCGTNAQHPSSGCGPSRKAVLVTGLIPLRNNRKLKAAPPGRGLPLHGSASDTAWCVAVAPHRSHHTMLSDRNLTCPAPSVPPFNPPTTRLLARLAHINALLPVHFSAAMCLHSRDARPHTVHSHPLPDLHSL